jgi:acyl carrier protein
MNKQGHVMPAGLERQIAEIISDATLVPVELLTADARPEALGIDSLGLVETIFALEETFGIKVPVGAPQGTEGFDMGTIGSITAGVHALMAAAKAA